jgi:hypothetical protein
MDICDKLYTTDGRGLIFGDSVRYIKTRLNLKVVIMTYLKAASIASLVGLSSFAVAAYGSNNEGGVMGNPISISVDFRVASLVEGYGSTTTAAANDGDLALANTLYSFQEAADKYPRLDFGGRLNASTDLNDSMGATAFFEIMAGSKDSKTHNLDQSAEQAFTVEHKMSYAPGVTLDYGCFGVGLKYNMIENNVKETNIGKLEEKAIMLGFTTSTALDLDDSVGALRLGFDAWTTIGSKAESEAKTFFATAANATNGGAYEGSTVTDTYYNRVELGFTFGFDLTQM